MNQPTKEQIKEQFRQQVLHCGSTGDLVILPSELDGWEAGNIMADVASFFTDTKQDIKAIIILEERRRLGV